ncbi:hypothetical protein L218DRAFT_1010775 [Marasmius fiardii PR-910]|nr:hypothetical protein L218DRAFT_1010775 [Marasmius fiardii PR-910]
MTNVVMPLTSRHFTVLLLSIERVAHSLLASRGILHIREIALQDNKCPDTMSEIQFAQMELRSLSSHRIGPNKRLFSCTNMSV